VKAPAVLTALFPHETPASRPAPAMMELQPAPRWIEIMIRVLQGNEGAIGAASLACAIALFAMMAIGMLVAWQTGLL
jgi:hypothetical protein